MPAPFTVDVYFLGILGFVPHPDGDKLAIVLPASDYDLDVPEEDYPTAADGRVLQRHRWFVEFDPGQLAGVAAPPPAGTLAQWTLSSPGTFRRLTFDCPDAGILDFGTGLDKMSRFVDVATNYADVPPAYLTWPVLQPKVGGQIMIDKGAFIPPANPARECTYWVLPPTLRLPDRPTTQKVVHLCHRVHLRFANVTTFGIIARSSQADPGEKLSLFPTAAEPTVTVTICNLCDHNPLRWPATGPLRVDDDFRWYYELSANKMNLPNDLYGLDLPVLCPSGNPGGVGQNCLETGFNAANFIID